MKKPRPDPLRRSNHLRPADRRLHFAPRVDLVRRRGRGPSDDATAWSGSISASSFHFVKITWVLSHPARVEFEAVNRSERKAVARCGAAVCGYTTVPAHRRKPPSPVEKLPICGAFPSDTRPNTAAVQNAAAMCQGLSNRRRPSAADRSFPHDSWLTPSLDRRGCARWNGSRHSFSRFPDHKAWRNCGRCGPMAEPQPLMSRHRSIFTGIATRRILPVLGQIKRGVAVVLLADEAHAAGCYGKRGAGLRRLLRVAKSLIFPCNVVQCAGRHRGADLARQLRVVRCGRNFGRAFVYSTAFRPSPPRPPKRPLVSCVDEPHVSIPPRFRALAVRAGRGAFKAPPVGVLCCRPEIRRSSVILGVNCGALDGAVPLRDKAFMVSAIRPPRWPRGVQPASRYSVEPAHG